MNFEQLDLILPNGFRDSQLYNLNVDYLKRTIRMDVNFWSDTDKKKPVHKAGIVTVLNFEIFMIDSPDKTYPYWEKGSLFIEAGAGAPPTSKLELPIQDSQAFAFWIFINSWNSFIRIVAKDLRFEWK